MLKKLGIWLLAALLATGPVFAQVATPPYPHGVTPGAPQWVQQLGNPKYFLRYWNNDYWGGNVSWGTANTLANRNGSLITEQNSGAATNTLFSPDTDGLLYKATGLNVPRINHYGMWVEGANACAGITCNGGSAGSTGATGQAADNSNFLLQNRNWDNAVFTSTNVTTSHTSVGADGTANTGTRLTATAANGKVCQTTIGMYPYDLLKVAGGAAYTALDSLTVVTTGGVCTTAPIIQATTVAAGAVATYKFTNKGNCSTQPTNPVAVTGGTGAGATFNLLWPPLTGSVWARRITGAGTVNLSIDDSTYTDKSGVLTTSYTNIALASAAAPASPQLCIKFGTNTDAIDVDFGQLENNPQATSPIVTTAAINLRGDEMPAFNQPAGGGNNAGQALIQDMYQGTPFCMYEAYCGNFSTVGSHLLAGTDASAALIPFITGAPGGGVLTISGPGGTYNTTGTDTASNCLNGAGVINKIVVCWDGGGSMACVNGTGPDKSTVVKYQGGSQSFSHAGQLNNGSGLTPTNGFLREQAWWKRYLTDGECVQYSTVTNNM